jgi:hypothetical protein
MVSPIREEHMLGLFWIKMLRRILRLKGEEVTGGGETRRPRQYHASGS